MTIRNLDKYIEGLWDWAILDGCFGQTKIKPTDIDGCVERNGYTLFIEAKRPGVPIPKGQEIMFKNWVKTGAISVMVVWGETSKPQHMQVFSPFAIEDKKPITLDDFRDRVAAWYQWASRQKAYSK